MIFFYYEFILKIDTTPLKFKYLIKRKKNEFTFLKRKKIILI